MGVTLLSRAQSLEARRSRNLQGVAQAPADKSISHRALLFAAAAIGESRIAGLSGGADVRATLAAMRALGCEIVEDGPLVRVLSPGLKALASPARPLDFGNSGTGARLAMGLVAGAGATATFIGDGSLSGRPMARVLDPLSRMGAAALAREGGRLPLTLAGPRTVKGLEHAPEVASAQVKSAILFAGLGGEKDTIVKEARATRDHTERMAVAFGAVIETEHGADGSFWAHLRGGADLRGADVRVPGDPSSAAFIAAAAALVPGSHVRIEGVCANPARFGFFEAIKEMGAEVTVEEREPSGGERIVDVVVRHGPLKAVDLSPERAPAMIDEYPILSVLCACAEGVSRLRGLGELRVKESDRFAAILRGLGAAGARVEAQGDDILVHGAGRPPRGGVRVATHGDHRIAMSFAVLGLAALEPMIVDEPAMIATSWPGFHETMTALGAVMRLEGAPA